MNVRISFVYLSIAILLVLGMLLGSCQPAPAPTEAPAAEEPVAEETNVEEPESEEPAEEEPVGEEPYVIRVGNTPFFDYQFWSVADEFGWDEELGLRPAVRMAHPKRSFHPGPC